MSVPVNVLTAVGELCRAETSGLQSDLERRLDSERRVRTWLTRLVMATLFLRFRCNPFGSARALVAGERQFAVLAGQWGSVPTPRP